ncbi:MAG: GNAT family N-acetyltransferase [Cellvibrio sp.]|uniref:GNAT family N-acetyltransferase n=1 Tax=Cellvibrio sp. TaxID=1965322 RepID=UPI0031A520AC
MSVRQSNFAEIFLLHNLIPELSPIVSSDYFAERIGEKDYLALVYEQDGIPVAYKLGYWINAQHFYSWLGGVHPDYRKQGIAKALLLEQEAQVRKLGGAEISVKSMNKYKSMLLLLISQGYDITGAAPDSRGEIKIHFAKKLD